MGLIAAIYVVATMLCSSLAYGQVQFRISEVLMLLCYFNKDYIISLSIGCLIVNLFSTLGMVDVVFGTLATVVAAVLIYLLRNKVNLVVASLFPVISNAVIVGFELTYVFKTPLLVNIHIADQHPIKAADRDIRLGAGPLIAYFVVKAQLIPNRSV